MHDASWKLFFLVGLCAVMHAVYVVFMKNPSQLINIRVIVRLTNQA